MSIYVVRHGQVPSNVKGIVSGCDDEELTLDGISQAEKIKKKLSVIEFDTVYSSPVKRAVQTAEIIVPDSKIIFDKRLEERHPGKMLGCSRKEINKEEWNSLKKMRTSSGAETLLSVLERTKDFLDEINDYSHDKNVLIVTHNVISKCIWIIKEDIKDETQINEYFHKNDEIKVYGE